MNLSLGYIKDVLAFITSIILIILFYGFNIKPPKILLPLGLFLIFVIDGIFTFYPFLHNLSINMKN